MFRFRHVASSTYSLPCHYARALSASVSDMMLGRHDDIRHQKRRSPKTVSAQFPTTLHSFEWLNNIKYRTGKATYEENETCFKTMYQNLIRKTAEVQEKFNLEHSVSGQKIEFPKHRLVVIPKAVYCGHYTDETRAVVTCCWITSLCAYIFTTWQRIGVITLRMNLWCWKGSKQEVRLAYKGGKNDDNKKRVMVLGSAKRVATLRKEGKKNQSFWIFDQQHRSMKCSIISNHICQCNLFSTILQQS